MRVLKFKLIIQHQRFLFCFCYRGTTVLLDRGGREAVVACWFDQETVQVQSEWISLVGGRKKGSELLKNAIGGGQPK